MSQPRGSIRHLGARVTLEEREAARQTFLDSNSAPRTRGPNRGQAVAPQRGHDILQEAEELTYDSDAELDLGEEPSRQYSRGPRSYRNQLQARERNWATALKSLATAQDSQRMDVAQYLRARNADEVANVEHRIAAFTEQPTHCCRGDHEASAASQIGERPLLYFSTHFSIEIKVPTFSCASCGQFEMPATACHCFPSSPVCPSMWIDISLLAQYSELFTHSGASSVAFCQSTAELHRHIRLLAGERSEGAVIEGDHFSSVWVKYLELMNRPVSSQSCEPACDFEAQYSPGVAGDCPVCAELPENSPLMEDRAILLDECQASLTGTSSPRNMTEPPQLSNTAAAEDPPQPSQQTVSPHPSEIQQEHSVENRSRPFCVVLDGNQKMSHYQRCGAGVDAVHEALRGTDLQSMPVFTYFGDLETALPEIDIIGLDVSCRFDAHVRNNFPEWQADGGARCLIGWMHSQAGHGLPCQLKYSGLYAPELGRCILENMEQLFAFTKKIAGPTRYMAKWNRRVVLDWCIGRFSHLKSKRFPELLIKAKATAKLRLQQTARDIQEVLQQAREAGIPLDPETPFEMTSNVAVYDDFMRYAKLRANLCHLESMLISGGAFVAAFDGTAAARSVVLRQQSQKTRTDLEKALTRLERKLGLAERPDMHSPQMQEACARLRAAEITDCQAKIEREVEFSNTLRTERRMEGLASRVARQFQNQLKRSRKRLREALASWQAWHAFMQPLGEVPPPYAEDEILRGTYPWDPTSGTAGITQEMLHLRLHQAQAEHQRCLEELQYLPQDAKKAMRHGLYQIRWLANYLDAMKQSVTHGRPNQQLLQGKIYHTASMLRHRLSEEAKSHAMLQSLI